MITQNDLQQIAPRVLQRLQELVVFPPKGTVAGQAVASVFFEELGLDVRGPINDVDFFVSHKLDPSHRGVVHRYRPEDAPYINRKNKTSATGQTFTEETDDYSQIKFMCARSNVLIHRSYTDGLRNFTLVRHGETTGDEHTVQASQDIVNGFDLNLVQVGINLDSGTVVVSDHFLEFLNTREIKATTCNTPTHTLIRLAKKFYSGEIVGAVCDFKAQADILCTYLQLAETDQSLLEHPYEIVLDVGQKYKQLAQTYAAHLPALIPSPNHTGLFRFDVSNRPSVECFTVLNHLIVQSAGSSESQMFVNYAFVANFPQLFEIAAHRHSRTEQQWAHIQKSFDTERLTPVERLNHLHIAFHNNPLAYTQMKMPERLAALFFFEQRAGKSAQSVARVVHQYNTLPFEQRLAVQHYKFKADAFEDVMKYPQNLERLTNAYLHLKGLECLNDSLRTESIQEQHDFFDWFLNKLRSDAVLRDKSQMFFLNSSFTDSTVDLFKTYPDEVKMDKINQLVEALHTGSPHWDTPHVVRRVLYVAFDNNVYDPRWWGEDYWKMENLLIEFGRGLPLRQFSPRREFIRQILTHATDSQLLDDGARLLINTLKEDYYDIVRERVFSMNSHWLEDGVLQQYFSDYGCWSKNPQILSSEPLDRNLGEKLLLEISTQSLQPKTRVQRKM